MSKTLRIALGSLGYSLLRSNPWADLATIHQSHLVFALATVFPSLKKLRFLQIGSNDGSMEDPISILIDQYKWRGTFVEGDPLKAELLKARRGNQKHFQIISTILCDHNGTVEFYSLKADELPDFARGLGTVSKKRIEEAQRDLGRFQPEIITRNLPCTSVRSFFDHVDRKFDLCVIDAEGLDFLILKLLHQEKAIPRVLLFEHKCLSRSDVNECFELLMQEHYNLLVDDRDCVAYRRVGA